MSSTRNSQQPDVGKLKSSLCLVEQFVKLVNESKSKKPLMWKFETLKIFSCGFYGIIEVNTESMFGLVWI